MYESPKLVSVNAINAGYGHGPYMTMGLSLTNVNCVVNATVGVNAAAVATVVVGAAAVAAAVVVVVVVPP
jgi:hypothetical protein